MLYGFRVKLFLSPSGNIFKKYNKFAKSKSTKFASSLERKEFRSQTEALGSCGQSSFDIGQRPYIDCHGSLDIEMHIPLGKGYFEALFRKSLAERMP